MPKGIFPRKRTPVVQRFEKLYIPEPNTGCWFWTGATKPYGYGCFWLDKRTMPSPHQAHRASWLIYRGSIPDGLFVLHRCDMPCCVNPDHLFLGTHRDNMQDCKNKGRLVGRRLKLTVDDVIAIRASQEKPTSIARQFGISATHACAIQKGRKRAGG